jgi:hypothetical protein
VVFSNTINTATAANPITIADDVAIMLDEAEFHPAAVKPVFSNLLLCGGVAPPRDNKASFGYFKAAGGCKSTGYLCTQNSECCK